MRYETFKIKKSPVVRFTEMVVYYRETGIENWEDIKDLELKEFVQSNSNPDKLWNLVKSENFL